MPSCATLTTPHQKLEHWTRTKSSKDYAVENSENFLHSSTMSTCKIRPGFLGGSLTRQLFVNSKSRLNDPGALEELLEECMLQHAKSNLLCPTRRDSTVPVDVM